MNNPAAWLRLGAAWAARLLPLLVLLLVIRPTGAQALDYTYTTNSGTITITRYTGSASAVDVPGTINGLPVASIGEYAFSSCGDVTSVMIPNSVTSIGDSAFSGCSGLTSVTIPNSVTNIGLAAFDNCVNLASVTIPNRITRIGRLAFVNCSSLTSVTIPNSVTSIGLQAFENCLSLTSVSIGNSVTNIAGYAFSNCPALAAITVDALNPAYSSVAGVLFDKNQTTLIQYPAAKVGSCVIPNTVTSIGAYTFERCSNLTSVSIGNSVEIIWDYAFNYCASLTSITIPKSVITIRDYAFANCPNLTKVYFKGNFHGAGWYGSGFSQYAFVNDRATLYYLPGTTGWGSTFAGLPTVLWNPQVQTSNASFGVKNNRFGFTITGTGGLIIVVEACTDIVNPTWFPVRTNTLAGGASYFSDPQWTDYPARFYRLRSP